MTELLLGEVQVSYDNKKGTAGTVEVAKILEAKYGLFSAFWEKYQPEIKALMISSLEGALISIHAGAPPASDPFAKAMQETEALFRKFLYTGEVEQMGILGVPTQAALDGRSHRFKNKKGPRRPSFIDTGTMELAFRSWLEGVMV